MPGDGDKISLAGDLAFIAHRGGGVLVLDVADPDAPQLLSQVRDSEVLYTSVATTGHFMFVGTSTGTVLVFDVSDPATPVLVNEVALTGRIFELWVDQQRMYAGASGIWVLDITDPSTPQVLGTRGSGQFRGVRAEGATAYVVAGWNFVIYDVSDPGSIQIIGQVDIGSPGRCATVFGDRALVGTTTGLCLLDISVPSLPTVRAELSLPDEAMGVSVSGTTAYVATADVGIQVVDVSSPELLELVGWYDTPGPAGASLIHEGLVYVAASKPALQILDPTRGRPAAPDGQTEVAYEPRGVDVAGNLCAVATESGLDLYDISELNNPQYLSSAPISYARQDVCVRGSLAYTTGATWTIDIADISEPANPSAMGSAEEGFGRRIEVLGDYAYVTGNGHDGFLVFDITDPMSPILAGSSTLPVSSIGIALDGDRAYVGDFDGVFLFDISDPVQPAAISKIALGDDAYGIAVKGDYAYVANGEVGFSVVDYSNPSQPEIVSELHDQEWGLVRDIAVQDNIAWVATSFRGVLLIDIADPFTPSVIGSYTPSFQQFKWLSVDDSRVIVTSPSNWIYTVDGQECDPCHADWNSDGSVDSRDVLAFLNAWASGDASADFNEDGTVDTRDLIGFLNAWTAGC